MTTKSRNHREGRYEGHHNGKALRAKASALPTYFGNTSSKSAFEITSEDAPNHTMLFGSVGYGRGHVPAAGHEPQKILIESSGDSAADDQ